MDLPTLSLSGYFARSPSRSELGVIVGLYVGVVAVLLALVWIRYGTEFGYNRRVYTYYVAGLVGLWLIASPWLSWRQRGAAAIAILGALLFLTSIRGICMPVGSTGNSVYGVTYDVSQNILRYGYRPVGTTEYDCGARPNRLQMLAGSLVATGGLAMMYLSKTE